MHHLTLAGAKLRLQQVQDEIAMLLSAFPELTGDAGHETPPADPSPTPRRRALSAAGRARIIEAQRAGTDVCSRAASSVVADEEVLGRAAKASPLTLRRRTKIARRAETGLPVKCV